jgi:Sec-independent protein translocase protein TatA
MSSLSVGKRFEDRMFKAMGGLALMGFILILCIIAVLFVFKKKNPDFNQLMGTAMGPAGAMFTNPEQLQQGMEFIQKNPQLLAML